MKIDTQQIEILIRILKESDLSEIEVESGKEKIRVARHATVRAAQTAAQPSVPPNASATQTTKTTHVVTSPFVGTFYRSPGPQARPFVEVGDRVSKGDVLCIVEAMKLMNEIETEAAGRVSQIFVQNGQAVGFGDRLFEVDLR